MARLRHYYIIRIQFLGFRYSGWQKQPNKKTVESMLAKTLQFVLPNMKFKILGAGRTDAKVSALEMAFELFLEDIPLENTSIFHERMNANLPPDIRMLEIEQVDSSFNIIKDIKMKEYVYLFSFGEKNHPFCAPFLVNIMGSLDIATMKMASKLYEGTHDFSVYTARLRKNTTPLRTIASCKIVKNTLLKANFFPKESYALHVKGHGFMRYQIRMMMGALIDVGKGQLSLTDIKDSLQTNSKLKLKNIAPGSGLLLNRLEFH